MYSKILADISNIFYKNYFIFKDMKTILGGEEILTGGIYGTLRSLNSIRKKYLSENGKIYLLFDNFAAGDNFRKDIDEGYKINRPKYEPSFYRGLDYLQLILLNYDNNYFTCKAPNFEADDLVYSLVNSFDKYDKVLLCSEDLDYSRCISDNVHWLQHNEIITKEIFADKFNFSPTTKKVILYKTLTGDQSDNIPIPVKGLRKEIILKLVNEFDDIYEVFNNIHKIEYLGKWKEEFIENKSRLLLNSMLVSFLDISIEELQEYIVKSEYNPKTLRQLYKLLGFTNITEIDNRIMNSFPEKEELNSSNFFGFEEIARK